MQLINGVYTQWFNHRHQRSGHLFQGRYKSILVQKDAHLLELARYIALNPVAAGLVDRPEAWRWSSYGAAIGLREPLAFHDPRWLLRQFAPDRQAAMARYRRFAQARIADPPRDSPAGQRAVFGDDAFLAQLDENAVGAPATRGAGRAPAERTAPSRDLPKHRRARTLDG